MCVFARFTKVTVNKAGALVDPRLLSSVCVCVSICMDEHSKEQKCLPDLISRPILKGSYSFGSKHLSFLAWFVVLASTPNSKLYMIHSRIRCLYLCDWFCTLLDVIESMDSGAIVRKDPIMFCLHERWCFLRKN